MALRKPARNVETSVGPGPYRIQVAAELSNTPPATLRAWERRYGVPVPQRTASAYRLYSAEDIALIRRMSDLVAGGVSPSEAARIVLAGATIPPDAGTTSPLDPRDIASERILSAIERWDGDAIDAELARLSYLFDPQSLFVRVLSPLLVEVGKRWERGELSIAQEHLLSEKLELLLRAQLRALDRRDGPLVLATCVDREDHVLGLLGAALRFATSGCRVVVLGTATPAEALGHAVRSMSPRLVGLSVTRVPGDAKSVFKSYARAIGKTPWVVGGPAAEKLTDAIEGAGGRVASPSAAGFSQQLREWLRSR
jgi:DNA-binding transcriptional MerR regulator